MQMWSMLEMAVQYLHEISVLMAFIHEQDHIIVKVGDGDVDLGYMVLVAQF